MPWYLPWSESIKKRASRYLLQRYLGQFLEEKLTLDQLTVDLYNGTGTVSDVRLDVQALNELGEQQNLPVEFVDGYICGMSVSIPWSSLLSDASFVEVSGLVITIQPKQRAESGVSMFESMWSSMTSSMQLAEECLKQGTADGKDIDQSQPLEGLELFAQTIDSILSRVKVKFVDTVIRLEHVPKDSTSGVAVEFRIKNIDYLDEAGSDPPTPPAPTAPDVQLQQGNRMYQVAAFSTKRFCLEGVTMYTDEYPSRARTFSRSVMSLSASSTPDSKKSESNFGTAPVTPTSSSPTQDPTGTTDRTSHTNLSLEPDPILFGKLSGRQEIRVKVKQTDGVSGPKVDLEVNLGSLTTFISPRQLHVLVELVHGLATPDLEDTSNVPPRSRCVEKPMDTSDFNRVEQELLHQLNPDTLLQNKGLQYTQGWSTASLDDSDDEFLPMRGAMSESVISNATSMDASTTSISSTGSSKCGSVAASPTHRYQPYTASIPLGHNSQLPHTNRTRKKSHKTSRNLGLDSDPTAEVSHFHVRISSLAVVLLHDDVLTLCVERDGTSLAHSSVQQMKSLAQNFFAELGLFAVSGYGHKDFEQAKDVFLRACQLNHIRLLAAPVIVDGNEKTTSRASSVNLTVTAASLELLECLVDKKTPTQNASVEYVELLRFIKTAGLETDPRPSLPLGLQPDVKLQFKYIEKAVNHAPARCNSYSRTDIGVSLQQCWSEIDITIIDRIAAVLNPQPLCKRTTNQFGFAVGLAKDTSSQQCFYQAVESPTSADNKTAIKVCSPFVLLKVRFPSPDLRPIHDMDRPPWWRRSVRKDVLDVELSDVTFQTSLNSRDPSQRFELQCREIQGLFQEADTDVPVPFIHASADDRNGNSLPDGGQGFGWPRIVVQVYPSNNLGDLDEVPELERREESMHYSSTDAFADSSDRKEPSPFSSKKVIHESDTPHGRTTDQDGEELVVPGDKAEIAEFIEHASRNSRVQLEINLPCASLQLSSKHLYELIYNRISTDMLLWESAAPKPKSSFSGEVFSGMSSAGSDFASTLLQESLHPAFSMCKSGIQYDTDSDSDDNDGIYFSVYEHRQRHKRKLQTTKTSVTGQSKVTVTFAISQGIINLHAPVRDSAGNVIPGQHGEIQIQFEEGNIFTVSGYGGKAGLGYVCVQVNQAALYHNGLVATPLEWSNLKAGGCLPPSHLESTIYKSEAGAVASSSAPVGTGSRNSLDMLSVAIKIQAGDNSHNLKTFRVAVGLRGSTLQHRMCPSPSSWFTQLVDLFDVLDYPVPGYDPPGVLTELHLHLWDCAVDYRPLYLPVKTLVTIGSFTVSSNIAAQTSSSTLRFIAEDASLFLSNKTKHRSAPVDLRRDYVCVLDLGLFELSLRLCDKSNGQNSSSPRVDLRASNNVLHIRTCSDSGKALTELLTYFASDGDLLLAEDQNSETNSSMSTDPLLINTGEETIDSHQHNANLSKSQTEHVHDLMEEAMKETKGSKKSKAQKGGRNKQGVEVFFFPDENHPLPTKPLAESLMSQALDEDDDDWESEFCMVDKEAGSGIMSRNGPPEVRLLTQDPVRVIDNHFSVPLGKTDLLRAPKHYPQPVLRYTLREMTIVWHMYGGEDFASTPSGQPPKKHVTIAENYPLPPSPDNHHYSRIPNDVALSGRVSYSKRSPTEVHFRPQTPQSPKVTIPSSQLSWQARGGPGRCHDVLMELQLNKVRFQHEVYPDNTTEASRQVLLISEVEVRDRLATSQINKFLYQYSSEARPKQSHANMVVVKVVHVRPDVRLRLQECCLKVSLLPLRLNIDQDSLLFLLAFFNDLSGTGGEEESMAPRHPTPTHHAPVMTVNVGGGVSEPETRPQTLLMLLEEDPTDRSSPAPSSEGGDRPPALPVFFRSVVFSPEVPIRLDYQGKRVDMTHGSLAGLLMGLGQLNCSELRLRRLSYRHGLLGFDKLLAFVVSEWVADIKKNQLPSLLGGVGPMHALVQLFQGIRDLFWLPVEQYQRDGRIVRGLQRGANSFTTSTAMAALELTNRLVQAIQTVAEMGYDMVSPGPSVRRGRRYNQPADIREGVANACALVREGLGETAHTIARVASQEHEHKGYSGAVGGVLRQIPPTVVKPIILATEATSNVLGGMRSQLVPDARREAAEKWRND